MMDDVTDELTATLWVDLHTSTCGGCRQGAFLEDARHDRVAPGFDTSPPGKPCGARFVEIRSTRIEYGPDKLRELRPDLPAGKPGWP